MEGLHVSSRHEIGGCKHFLKAQKNEKCMRIVYFFSRKLKKSWKNLMPRIQQWVAFRDQDPLTHAPAWLGPHGVSLWLALRMNARAVVTATACQPGAVLWIAVPLSVLICPGEPGYGDTKCHRCCLSVDMPPWARDDWKQSRRGLNARLLLHKNPVNFDLCGFVNVLKFDDFSIAPTPIIILFTWNSSLCLNINLQAI